MKNKLIFTGPLEELALSLRLLSGLILIQLRMININLRLAEVLRLSPKVF